MSKTAIALKEARESHYWLRLIAASDPAYTNQLQALVQEARDILGAINSKARSNPRR